MVKILTVALPGPKETVVRCLICGAEQKFTPKKGAKSYTYRMDCQNENCGRVK